MSTEMNEYDLLCLNNDHMMALEGREAQTFAYVSCVTK